MIAIQTLDGRYLKLCVDNCERIAPSVCGYHFTVKPYSFFNPSRYMLHDTKRVKCSHLIGAAHGFKHYSRFNCVSLPFRNYCAVIESCALGLLYRQAGKLAACAFQCDSITTTISEISHAHELRGARLNLCECSQSC